VEEKTSGSLSALDCRMIGPAVNQNKELLKAMQYIDKKEHLKFS